MSRCARSLCVPRAAVIVCTWLGAVVSVANSDGLGPVEFYSRQTQIPVGQSRAIPFRLAQPAGKSAELEASAEPTGSIEVLRQPSVLAGETTGYVRVRGLKPGETRLRVGDRAAITVIVRPEPSAVDAALFAPRIVTPAAGACVWGTFAVGVEAPAQSRSISLQLPGGKKLAPQKETSADDGPLRSAFFTVDAAELGRGGPSRLLAIAEQPDGASLSSEPHPVTVVNPSAQEIVAGECEASLSGSRPERFGKEPPKVGSRPDASGGAFVLNYGANPAWCLPFEAKEAGDYQVVVVARGDPAAGVYPTIGLYVDDANEAATAARLFDKGWHRVPVGRPVRLDAGPHMLTVYFLNDFHVPNAADRNLYLDRYEVARVDAPAAGGESTMLQAMTMTTMQPGDGAMMSDGAGDALSVAFVRPFHNQPVTGRLVIEGYCHWANPEKSPPPQVTLLVNGKPALTQQAAAPLFWLDRSSLNEGTNTVQLRAAHPICGSAVTPVQSVVVAPVPGRGAGDKPPGTAATTTPVRPRAFHRFTARDDGWDDVMRKLLSDKDQPKGHGIALFASNGGATLRLPEELAGDFDLFIESRAEEYKGPPKLAFTLRQDGAEKPVCETDVTGWWNTRKVSTATLAKGPKQLTVAFTNDLREEKRGDRNVWLKSVILREASDKLDRAAPRVALLYPKPKHSVNGADAVIAEAFDDDDLAWADLVIDGQPQKMNQTSPTGLGRFVFPLLARSLAPGTHRLSIIVQDDAGNTGESQEIEFTVADRAPRQPGPYARAVRLLKRFGYGPEPGELAAVLTMGERAWLADRLGRPFDSPGERAVIEYATARFPGEGNGYQVGLRVAQQWMLTDNPVRARFVNWVENHFSTWIRKSEARAEWEEHLRFSQLGAATFADLLLASATSPAMLIYLDQNRSFANAINENYAREIMELHTLGVNGGYAQRDVTELARLFTGWTVADEADETGRGQPLARGFRFDPKLNDGGACRVVGASFAECPPSQRYDRVRFALEVLAAHPSTARFVCRKLADHYVSTEAPERMVDDLAKVFHETGGGMKAVLLALAEHPGFWDPNLPARLNTPMDYGIGLSRACGDANPWGLADFLLKSGMGVFDHAMPNGYPDDDPSYADSNALMQRWRFAQQARWSLNRLVPGPWHSPSKPDPNEWRQDVVDAVALRLTGQVLADASNKAALDVFAAAKGKSWEQTLQTATFVAQLPEANLR